MCGIAGYSGFFEGASLLADMGHVMAARGPDDFGKWVDSENHVGLCHRRLSIIDLSPAGHQPMWGSSGSVVIVFNGEIYNYLELKSELIRDGFSFASATDTEVLLNLYLRDGWSMLPKLNGMFAFAIWDRNSRELFVARDGMGIKPLYYAELNEGFIFASTLSALLCSPNFIPEINPASVVNYLTLLYSPAPATMLKQVSKLEPGHALLIRSGRVTRKWQWFEVPFTNEKANWSLEQAESQVLAGLGLATQRQMIADVPVGAFLSGGLDSSALVALARHRDRSRRLECFTISFGDAAWNEEGMIDDLPYAAAVAKHLSVRLNVIEVGAEIFRDLHDTIYHLDEPQADPAAFHVRSICKLSRELGVKVLLSGTGGDDLFSGYRRHDALFNERYWSWLPLRIRATLVKLSQSVNVNSPNRRRFAKAFRYADRDSVDRISTYFYWIDPLLRSTLLGPMLQNLRSDDLGCDPLREKLHALPHNLSHLDCMLYLEQKFFLADHNLNYTDKMSMAESVEVRVPFLDPDLLSTSWSLSDKFKHNHGTGKWIFRKAMEPLLPRSVIYRPKTGFGVPLRRWIHNELRIYVEEFLSPSRINRRGLFDSFGVQKLIALDKAGKVDGAYTIFALLCIEIWCCLFIDGEWRSYIRANRD